MELPRSLFCLTLAHNIDDRDIIEQLLADFPDETEQCIPIALRSVLEVDYLPPVPFFSGQELIRYLSHLWADTISINDKLRDAARNDLIYLVAYYLDRNVNIHAYNDVTLRWAAEKAHAETVKLLLDRNADIHALDDGPLRDAAYGGRTETVKLLLDRKADIHALGDHALRRAALKGHYDTVKLLLDRKADIHADNDNALRYAAGGGHTAIVKLLIERNADPTILGY